MVHLLPTKLLKVGRHYRILCLRCNPSADCTEAGTEERSTSRSGT